MQFCKNCNNSLIIFKIQSVDIPIAERTKFKCENCGYTEPIKSHTLVLNRINGHQIDETALMLDKFKLYVNDPTLPHTRNYICPNSKCVTHKDHAKRDAVWVKPDKVSYKIITICTACETVF